MVPPDCPGLQISNLQLPASPPISVSFCLPAPVSCPPSLLLVGVSAFDVSAFLSQRSPPGATVRVLTGVPHPPPPNLSNPSRRSLGEPGSSRPPSPWPRLPCCLLPTACCLLPPHFQAILDPPPAGKYTIGNVRSREAAIGRGRHEPAICVPRSHRHRVVLPDRLTRRHGFGGWPEASNRTFSPGCQLICERAVRCVSMASLTLQ